ncbi:MAG: hypothetical protein FWF53_05715 [Candidatus Azobacteroides sp.]|nr:hypothetical protein [Candidatus Azobacteroides sp.]
MHTRLLEIIRYKTGGRQTEFAALVGWSPQYIAKLLRGENFGLQPALTLILKFPEINARWLLTGQGDMFENKKYDTIRKKMHESISKLLDIEKYMPVMSPIELREFEQVVTGKRKADFKPETVEKWEGLLRDGNNGINAELKAKTDKSNELCKTRKGKK